ncbi:MAG: histidine phosphatase family protein [Deltaproteobacteria bacterium]|nr:histidine phosphatase family protein [Deltaproteobacteria bacterium]
MSGYIYLCRHGLAEPAAAGGDRARALTAEGQARVERLVAALGSSWSAGRVVTSPFVRARQTAERYARALSAALVEEPTLGSGILDGAQLLALVRRHGPGNVFVGHNPEMADAIGRVAGAGMAVTPGTIAAVRWEDARLVLEWARDE